MGHTGLEDRVKNLDFVLSVINQNFMEHFKQEYNQI